MAAVVSCPHCLNFFPADGGAGPITCRQCGKSFFLTEDVVGERTSWYVMRGGRQFGPYSLERLRELAEQNRVLTTDQVTRVGSNRWVLAGSLRSLFPHEDLTPVPDRHTLLSDSDDMILFDVNGELVSGPLSARGLHAKPSRSLSLADFQIVRKLGAGGMGAVYLAWQRSVGRRVALKVLSKRLAAERAYVDRFFREADVLAGLAHPNIITFYGVGRERELPYFAMEFVDGLSSAAAATRLGGRLPVPDALHVTLRCAHALAYAHCHRIVHRDIKPENVMITRLGRIKVTDLGLAKPLGEDTSLTDTGTVLGTPKYMAPEQAYNAKHADARSDLYALGGVLYHLLTGQPPFAGESMMELQEAKDRAQFTPARRLNPDVPPRLDLMLDKLLARNPRYRYQSAEELIRDVEALGLAGAHLSFNPLKLLRPAAGEPEPPPRVEILLIQNQTEDIILAQEALEDNDLPSNMHVVADGAEALAYLRREGDYAAAPQPALILLGRKLRARGTLDMLVALRDSAQWRSIPVVLLDADSETAAQLAERGLHVSLSVAQPEGKRAFARLVRSLRNLCDTIIDLPRDV